MIFQEILEDAIELIVLDEESVMAVRRRQARVLRTGNSLGNLESFLREEQPVRVHRNHQRSRGDLPQRLGDPPAIATDVVAEHRATQRNIGARIETTHELCPVVVQVGLDSQTPAA